MGILTTDWFAQQTDIASRAIELADRNPRETKLHIDAGWRVYQIHKMLPDDESESDLPVRLKVSLRGFIQ